MGKDLISSLLAQKRVQETLDTTKQAREKLEEQLSENRQIYEKFHNSLALFSSGTIALSVTFLGYLKSLPGHAVMCPRILVASWIVLLVGLVTALFNSFFHAHYLHFGAAGDYLSVLARKNETVASAMDELEIVNLDAEQKQKQQEKHREIAGTYGKERDSVRGSEKFYKWLWVWCSRVARFAFPIGLILLVIFAIKNM